jgi:hypothetical protein
MHDTIDWFEVGQQRFSLGAKLLLNVFRALGIVCHPRQCWRGLGKATASVIFPRYPTGFALNNQQGMRIVLLEMDNKIKLIGHYAHQHGFIGGKHRHAGQVAMRQL